MSAIASRTVSTVPAATAALSSSRVIGYAGYGTGATGLSASGSDAAGACAPAAARRPADVGFGPGVGLPALDDAPGVVGRDLADRALELVARADQPPEPDGADHEQDHDRCVVDVDQARVDVLAEGPAEALRPRGAGGTLREAEDDHADDHPDDRRGV